MKAPSELPENMIVGLRLTALVLIAGLVAFGGEENELREKIVELASAVLED